jgi:tagatose 6-phosphate kinase
MFLCVSANPAVDKRIRLERLQRGAVNRVESAVEAAGGKAAHVAMVLRTLGESPDWIGPCGGATGQAILEGLSRLGIHANGVFIEGSTRMNLELLENDGTVTEILEPGPHVNDREWHEFFEKCEERFTQGKGKLSAIFSGSLPSGTKPDLYARLIAEARGAKCRTLLDTSGDAFRAGLEAKPDFVKPNREEAARLLGTPVDSLLGGVNAVRKLLDCGAQSAALSLGRDGLLFCAETGEGVLHASGPTIEGRSSVGCGDSAVAGFAFGLSSGLSADETLRLAAACGTANCLAHSPGAAKIEDIRKFQEQIIVRKLG